MRFKRCNNHDDRVKATWRDTAGRLWHEFECRHCGRLHRELA